MSDRNQASPSIEPRAPFRVSADQRDRLSRRTFLQSATALAGAVMLGANAIGATGADATGASVPAVAVAYWDGSRLIDAARLPASDGVLSHGSVRIDVHAHVGEGRTLRGLSALYPIDGGARVPFHAWTLAGRGNKSTAFTMPACGEQGISLVVRHAASADAQPIDTPVPLAALRAGAYVIAAHGTDWNRYHVDPSTNGLMDGGAPARIDHLTLAVRAV